MITESAGATAGGGAAASPLLAEKANCDFYGKTAVDTVRWSLNTEPVA